MIKLSTIHRGVAIAGCAVALALGGLSATPAAASQPTMAAVSNSAAQPLVGSCASASLCLWRDSGWGGTRWTFTFGHYTSNAWIYVGNGANDQASSLFNNRAWVSGIAADLPVQTNGWACVRGGSSAENLQNFSWRKGVNMNDSISAFDLSTGTISNCPSTL
jgi:hypothetical protein